MKYFLHSSCSRLPIFSIRPFQALALVALGAVTISPGALACSECGCSLSSDWAALGYTMAPGFETGVRFEYYDQTELRRGTGRVDRAALDLPNDDEIQQRTLNRNTWLDLNYVVNTRWAVTASVPVHDRFHTTIAEGDTAISTSRAHGLGDVRLLGRYQVSGASHSFGLQFGLKLPTGRIDQDFAEGPQAGELLDRGLQLGTGTTNLLVGASWFTRPSVHLGLFAQVSLDQPLAARSEFRPSTSLNFSSGIRWLNPTRLTPQLQLNIKSDGREHGAAADTANSGGTLAYLSPGLTAELSGRASAFVFVQLPVYQQVNGLQLEPKWILSVGLRWKI